MLSDISVLGTENITMDFMTDEAHIIKNFDRDALALFKEHIQRLWRPIRVKQARIEAQIAELEDATRDQADRIIHLERQICIAEMTTTAKTNAIERVRQSMRRQT